VARRAVAEALGTALLLAAVVGSGIMGEQLAGGERGDRTPCQHNRHWRGPRRFDSYAGTNFGSTLQLLRWLTPGRAAWLGVTCQLMLAHRSAVLLLGLGQRT
jgi:hypothetical protein